MAKCKAHGAEIGTIYFTTSAKRYMSDGVLLRNNGFGWKLHGKVKEGRDIAAVYEKAVAAHAEYDAMHPAVTAYRKALHDMAGLSKRWKLHLAVSLMPEDCDGVWSEACDGYGDNVHADVDEVGALCRLYLSAMAEQKQLKAA